MDKLIIAVGLNENATRDLNPNIPITPEEIAQDVKACVEAGASVIHLHARDPKTGAPMMNDTQQYLRIFHAIRKVADVPVYPTYPTNVGLDERYRHVIALAQDAQSHLEIAPCIAGTTNLVHYSPAERKFSGRTLDQTVLFNPYSYIVHHLEFAKEHDLWVSHDVFESGMVRNVITLWEMGYYHRPMLLKFFMAEHHPFGFPPEPRFLKVFAEMLPKGLDTEWLFLPFGVSYPKALECWKWAIENGGHVRVGVGDNPAGQGYLPTNAERVAEIARIARVLGRQTATVAEVRARFSPFKRKPAQQASRGKAARAAS